MQFMMSRYLLVIDVETTGLDPLRHACIEVGAVLLDKVLTPVAEFSSLIGPWTGAEVLEDAMKVHGIVAEELQNAPHISDAVRHFDQVFMNEEEMPLLAGWNVWFDTSFLRDLYRRAEMRWPFAHRLLDIQSVFSFHSGLASISQEYAIQSVLNEEQMHRALEDARHTSRLLKTLAERFLID